MEAQLKRMSRSQLVVRRQRAIEALRDQFTEQGIRDRARNGTLCDCERDTAHEIETVDFLLGEGDR